MIFIPFLIDFVKTCERHLVAEDPYQFRHLTTDQLVSVFLLNKANNFKSEALENEIKMRLENPDLPPEDREILMKITQGR